MLLNCPNFGDHLYLPYKIGIGELTAEEKRTLFNKILGHKDAASPTDDQKEKTIRFLNELSSFPLDISLAAYYVKVTNTSFPKYLEGLSQYKNDFDRIQTTILKEVGNYTKSRYGIITLSLKEIIQESKDFADLCVLISLLDTQNIPRDLLESYKGPVVVDNFIYHLKKYSLVINGPPSTPSSLSSFSIHRSTQKISFIYLSQQLALTQDSQLLKAIANTLYDQMGQAIEEEDFSKMKILVRHLEKFISHPGLLTDFTKGLLRGELGCLYYFMNSDQTHKTLDDSLNALKRQNSNQLSREDTARLIRSFLHIAAVYTELRHHKEAQELLGQAIDRYEKGDLKNEAELSWALSHLGNIHRRLENYEKAKDYLEESVRLHKQYGTNNKRIARTLCYLGSAYIGLGFYQKAIEVLERSLILYKRHYSDDHFRIGWLLTQLGYVHHKLGDYQKAKGYFESGLFISKKYFPETHKSMYLALPCLGITLRKLGDYEASCCYLEQSLKIYQGLFDENHPKMGWVLFHLAKTYQALGKIKESEELLDKVLEINARHCGENSIKTTRLLRHMAEIHLGKNQLEQAEPLIKKSIKILQHHNHVETYMALEILGEIYVKRFIQASRTRSGQDPERFKDQAIDHFNQALNIIAHHFPKDSHHNQRIHARIKNLHDGAVATAQ